MEITNETSVLNTSPVLSVGYDKVVELGKNEALGAQSLEKFQKAHDMTEPAHEPSESVIKLGSEYYNYGLLLYQINAPDAKEYLIKARDIFAQYRETEEEYKAVCLLLSQME